MTIKPGDYVDCYGDKRHARLIGEVVSAGKVNLKVRTWYNPGGLPEPIEQIHTVAKTAVREVQRPRTTHV